MTRALAAPVTFTVTGDWHSILDPSLVAAASDPQVQPVNALLTFTPRLPKGFVAYMKDFNIPNADPARSAHTGITLANRLGRIWLGQLCAVDVKDTPGVVLVANDPALGLEADGFPELIYDVTFAKIQFGPIQGHLQNFAFKAPAGNTTICLTDPALERIKWQKPA